MREKRVVSSSLLVFRRLFDPPSSSLWKSWLPLCTFCVCFVPCTFFTSLLLCPSSLLLFEAIDSRRDSSLESHQRRVYMYRILPSSLFSFSWLLCLLPAHKTAWMWHKTRWYMTWHHLVTLLGFYASFHPSMQLFCLSSSVSFMSCVWIESRKQFFHSVSFLLHPLFSVFFFFFF